MHNLQCLPQIPFLYQNPQHSLIQLLLKVETTTDSSHGHVADFYSRSLNGLRELVSKNLIMLNNTVDFGNFINNLGTPEFIPTATDYKTSLDDKVNLKIKDEEFYVQGYSLKQENDFECKLEEPISIEKKRPKGEENLKV